MKNYIKLTLLLGVLACSTPEIDEQNNEPNENPSSSEEVVMPTNSYGIVLNNGQRWVANPETTQSIDTMLLLIAPADDLIDTNGYSDLEERLQNEYSRIFKRCTMKGEAHNQLHSYLMPLKKKIVELGDGSLEKRKGALQDLKVHLELYADYFE